MNIATKKWIFLKISSLILIPLMFWFILNFISIYDKSFEEILPIGIAENVALCRKAIKRFRNLCDIVVADHEPANSLRFNG